jgi:D-alanine-D-alanine ligase
MIIGITYDLREDYLAAGYGEEETAEFDRPETIEAIEEALYDLGHETDRIGNVRNLVSRLSVGDRWEMVFNIAEGLRGFGREAVVPGLLEAYNIPYTFSDPLILCLTLHKGLAKRVIRDLGIPTADFTVVENESDIGTIELPFPLFAKPVAEGTGKGITAGSKILNRRQLGIVCRRLLKKYGQPVLVETFLPGREFTVGIVGTGKDAKVIGVLEVILRQGAESDVYSYINKEQCEELVQYKLVSDPTARRAQELALAAWKGLGCRDAGRVDLRADACQMPNLMEINPLPGLHPDHSDLPILCTLSGISYGELISMVMQSAMNRLRESEPSLRNDALAGANLEASSEQGRAALR